jgi:hypothetical protein
MALVRDGLAARQERGPELENRIRATLARLGRKRRVRRDTTCSAWDHPPLLRRCSLREARYPNSIPAGRQSVLDANGTRGPDVMPAALQMQHERYANCHSILRASSALVRCAQTPTPEAARVLRALCPSLTSTSAYRGRSVSVRRSANRCDRKASRGRGCRGRFRCIEMTRARPQLGDRRHPRWYCPCALRKGLESRRETIAGPTTFGH